jgi:hypothetical protein
MTAALTAAAFGVTCVAYAIRPGLRRSSKEGT